MRLLFLDAKNFDKDELQCRLFSYCENHIVDCVFIADDSNSSLHKRLSVKLADKQIHIFSERQSMIFNGISIDFDGKELKIEEQLIPTYPDTCTYVNIINKKPKIELIYMNLYASVSANPQKMVQAELEKIIDELLDSGDLKNRNFN